MVKKVCLILIIGIIATCVGGYTAVKSNSQSILGSISREIEKSTGKPLQMERLPSINLFPPSVELGPATWGTEDGPLAVSFTNALIKVAGSSIFSGSLKVNSVEIEGLTIHARQRERTEGTISTARAVLTASGANSPLANKLDIARAKIPQEITLKDATLTLFTRRNQRLDITHINGTLAGKNGLYTAEPVTFTWLGSQFQAKIQVDLGTPASNSQEIPLHIIQLKGDTIQLAQLSQALLQKELAEGEASLEGTIRFDLLAPLMTMEGTGQLQGKQITMAQSLLPSVLVQVGLVQEHTTIDNLQVNWSMVESKLSMDNGQLDSPHIQMKAAGHLNLQDQTVDIKGTVTIADKTAIPVHLSGPIRQPSYTVEGSEAVEALQNLLKGQGIDMEGTINQGINRLLRRR